MEMDETSKNSMKLDIEVRTTEKEAPRETYKAIPEDTQLVENNIKAPPKDQKMVQNGDNVHDGADEKMLSADEKERLAKKDEVKFISGDQQNGDAKIDIGTVDKTFTGMTKDELMKYANDPFWIRLRWIFFILFWALWIAMLIGAIMIIINAPKCAAPKPLVWWEQGPLVNSKSQEFNKNDIEVAAKIKAKGIIYELPPQLTYRVRKEKELEDRLKGWVEECKQKDLKIILDITPNYVTEETYLFKDAFADETRRSAFIWVNSPTVPNEWKSKSHGQNQNSAWAEVKPQNFVLNQFGEGKYDLQMNDPIVKEEFKEVLKHFISIGIIGFRLINAKHFIIDRSLKKENVQTLNTGPSALVHTDYDFWTHTHTTFQDGLAELLHEFQTAVNSSTDGEGFLSVAEDLVMADKFRLESSGPFGVDIPIYERFPHVLADRSKSSPNLYTVLSMTFNNTGNTTKLQWNYDLDNLKLLDVSTYNIFLMLLPGVPVIPIQSQKFNEISEHEIKHLENMRLSSSYMHGTFNIHNSSDIIAFSQIKSGNPGFFVALNPTNSFVKANFSLAGLPEKMTVDLLSANYNDTNISAKTKIDTESIPLTPYSALVATYVPVKK